MSLHGSPNGHYWRGALTLLALLSAGCGSEPSTSSVATEPTVSFDYGEEVTWIAMEGLLVKGEPAFPVPIANLAIGMSGSQAQVELRKARDPKLPGTVEEE